MDDLQALMDLLRPSLGAGESLKVEFDGGNFTEAIDLPLLSDEEVKSLQIKTARIEITLRQYAAIAVGDEALALDVYRLWARARQRGRAIINRRDARIAYAILAFGAVLATIAVLEVFVVPGPPTYDALPRSIGMFAIASSVLFGGAALGILMARTGSSVVVEAMTLSEYRARLANNRYPRLSYMVAVVAVVVAIATVAVSVVIK